MAVMCARLRFPRLHTGIRDPNTNSSSLQTPHSSPKTDLMTIDRHQTLTPNQGKQQLQGLEINKLNRRAVRRYA